MKKNWILNILRNFTKSNENKKKENFFFIKPILNYFQNKLSSKHYCIYNNNFMIIYQNKTEKKMWKNACIYT